MDVKKAYRGAKAALRTAENEVVYLQDEVVDLRQRNLELYYDLRDAEELIADLQYQLDIYSKRPTRAEALRLGVLAGLSIAALHVLALYVAALVIW